MPTRKRTKLFVSNKKVDKGEFVIRVNSDHICIGITFYIKTSKSYHLNRKKLSTPKKKKKETEEEKDKEESNFVTL